MTRPRQFVPWALLVGLTFLAYLPALDGGFLWDDNAHVTKEALRSLHGLWRIWTELDATQQYYPLLHTAFWLEHQLWGDATLGYHLVNVTLHAIAACLVVVLARQLLVRTEKSDDRKAEFRGADWLAGFIFALHPVCVESVAWISEQKNTLSAVFYLAAGLVYLRFDRERRPGQYWAAFGLFLLAITSKTVTVTLPAALLVIFWWKRGGLRWRGDVLPLLPWLAIGVGAGLLTAWVERHFIGASGSDFDLSAVERVLLAGRVILFYLGKLLWPGNLVFIYPRWDVDAGEAWQYLFPFAAIGLVGALLWRARRQRGPLAGFLLFGGTLFPALGFFNVYPFKFSYVADHFQYLASLGVIVPLSAGLTWILNREPFAGLWVRGGLIGALALLTWQQCWIYRDSETLYRDTLARNPDCSLAYNNLGMIAMEVPSRAEEARSLFESAIRTNPRNIEAHNNLATVLARIPGHEEDAIRHCETALQIDPKFGLAHNNLANVLAKIPGRLPEAIEHYRAAVQLLPDEAGMHDNLGTALLRTPDGLPEAIQHFETAVKLYPTGTALRTNLGLALTKLPDRLAEGIDHLSLVVEREPDSAQAHEHLGTALARVPSRVPEAIAHFETALRLNPNSAAAHGHLGAALLQRPGRSREAMAHFETAVRLDPNLVEARQVLGILLSGIPGRRADALEHFEAILRIRPDFAPAREWANRLRASSR